METYIRQAARRHHHPAALYECRDHSAQRNNRTIGIIPGSAYIFKAGRGFCCVREKAALTEEDGSVPFKKTDVDKIVIWSVCLGMGYGGSSKEGFTMDKSMRDEWPYRAAANAGK